MPKSIYHFKHEHNPLFIKLVYVAFIFSLFIIMYGVSGIIEHKSPQNMENVITLGTGFIAYFEYHLLILMGALVFTFTAWFMSDQSK